MGEEADTKVSKYLPLEFFLMASYNARQYTDYRGLNLKAGNGVIRFETPDITPTSTSGERLLYVDSSNQLVFDNGSSATVVGQAGGSGGSLDAAYDSGRTITVNNGAVTLNGVDQDTAVLAITGDGDSGGALITFAHTTATRNDLLGTGSSWQITGQGNATFNSAITPTIVAASSSNVNLTIDAAGSGTIAIGATSTGAVTITPALTATASVTITGSGGSDVFTVTAGDLVVTDGSLILTDADNSVSLKVTNNTATTVGASAATGVVELASTSLTTGTLLHLELTEGTLNGGHYLKCWDVTAGAAVFTIGENGDVAITGTADATALSITTGDFVMSDGKVAITNQDNEDTLAVVNNGLTSASALDLSGSGTFTGSTTSSFVHVSPSGLTTGTVAYLVANALTTGKVIHVSATAQTDGILLDMTGGGANITANGRVAKLSMGAGTVGQALEVVTTGVYTGAGVVTVTADSATTAGASVGQGIVTVSGDGLTTGTALDVTSTSIVLTTGRLADLSHISGNITGTLDKTGDLVSVVSTRTVTTGTVADDFDMGSFVRTSVINGGGTFTATGSVVYVQNVVTNTSGTVTDTTNGLEVVMSANGTGSGLKITHSAVAAVVVDVVSTATTTGKLIDLSDANALTTGIGIHVASSATAITGAGRLLYSNHTGATTTSGILNEFASAANDETVIVKITASDALATGNALAISAASMTTGKGINMSDLNALTSGIGLHIASSATAITGAGRLIYSNHTGATGSSAILNEFATAANDETVLMKLTASDALAAGVVLQLSAAAMTTGKGISLADANALTTGNMLNLVSNSSDSSARNLAFIHNDHASATGAVVLALRNDAPTSTNFRKIQTFSNGTQTVTFWMSDGSTSPNTALTGTAGDVCYGADSGKTYYCTGTTNWTAFA